MDKKTSTGIYEILSTNLRKAISSYLTVDEFRIIKTRLRLPLKNKLCQILSPLQLSTITVGGSLSNIKFNEELHFNKLKPRGKVLVVLCNYYEAYLKHDGTFDEQIWDSKKEYPTFPIAPDKKIPLLNELREFERIRVNKILEQYCYPCTIPKKSSNRGRKKQEKKVKKRKTQGSGKCFNSGIQFTIKGDDPNRPDKYYKIKVYRNGSFTIPGSLKEDLSDTIHPLEVISKFYSESFNTTVNLIEKHIIMLNYKCRLLLDDTRFDIDKLLDLIYLEKKSPDSLSNIYGIKIAEITYSADRYAGLTIKFSRDQNDIKVNTEISNKSGIKKRNKNKKTTAKILQSCKINIDGAIERAEVYNIWQWLNELILNNYDIIVYDSMEIPLDSDSSDTDKSEYDDINEDIYKDKYENDNSDHDDSNFDYIVKNTEKIILKTKLLNLEEKNKDN